MNLAEVSKAAIIVAGGSGRRMGADIPKQFLLLAGKPVLFHTLNAFYCFDAAIRLIVVLPESHINRWQQLCAEYHIDIPHTVTAGGTERFHSVKNGLSLVQQEDLVAVHDGVRPLASNATIERCFAGALTHGAAVPVVPVADTLRKKDLGSSHWVNRADYLRVQTPQCFGAEILRNAYRADFSPAFTDDASVVEHAGHAIALVEGNEENLKITSPTDLRIAEALMAG